MLHAAGRTEDLVGVWPVLACLHCAYPPLLPPPVACWGSSRDGDDDAVKGALQQLKQQAKDLASGHRQQELGRRNVARRQQQLLTLRLAALRMIARPGAHHLHLLHVGYHNNHVPSGLR